VGVMSRSGPSFATACASGAYARGSTSAPGKKTRVRADAPVRGSKRHTPSECVTVTDKSSIMAFVAFAFARYAISDHVTKIAVTPNPTVIHTRRMIGHTLRCFVILEGP
jgi:hypothetical protein